MQTSEKIRVQIWAEDHHWGYVIKKLPDNPTVQYYTIMGYWALHVQEGDKLQTYVFRKPISFKKFQSHCKEIDRSRVFQWVYECDKDYINKLINSKNAIKL